ncbi:hypothetical protein ACHAWU_006657 [Discostella pseudostelligera]|uniref:PNPLA domain-containing protein n=1 Tax=Discostella pseudostelligera TaxID=259834 RepID=A0ABD3M0C2_9STRA
MSIMVFIRNLVLVVNITLFSSWYYASASAAFLHRPTATSPPWLLYRQTTKHHLNHQTSLSSASSSKQNVYIAFPGGGLFFYWQAGVLAYLQQEGYTLSEANLSGASAGALSATLAKMNVCPLQATELALSLSEDANVWERPLGLQGVWGKLIYEWLDRLVPEDAEARVTQGGGELHILLTPVPSFGKCRISQFENRLDLINANMASVHLPWFLDGKLTSNFRGRPHIDGSFLARPSDYFDYDDDANEQQQQQPTILLDFKRDPLMKERAMELIKVVSKQTIWDILERGKIYGKIMDANGEFRALTRY